MTGCPFCGSHSPSHICNGVTNANWQTKSRGTNDQEYQIYKDCVEGTGIYVKTYDEWLNS